MRSWFQGPAAGRAIGFGAMVLAIVMIGVGISGKNPAVWIVGVAILPLGLRAANQPRKR